MLIFSKRKIKETGFSYRNYNGNVLENHHKNAGIIIQKFANSNSFVIVEKNDNLGKILNLLNGVLHLEK